MLKKLERLKDKYLFNLAFKKKQKVSSGLLHLYYLLKKKDINMLSNNALLPKTAFIVGLKIDKKSTGRNLIKRRMKAAYQLLKKKLINTNKYSVLIWISNPAIKNATFGQIKDSMEGLMIKLLR